MKYAYPAVFTPIEDGSGFYAKVPDLPLSSVESCSYIKADTLAYRTQTDTRSVREFVKRLVLAQDPDYTKLTPEERSSLEAAEQGGIYKRDGYQLG